MRLSILWSAFTSTRLHATSFTAIALTAAAVLATSADADTGQDAAKPADSKSDTAKKSDAPPAKTAKLGVLANDSRAFPGFNLINPGRKNTYLYDNAGRVVHSWTSDYSSGAAAYLLENGHLFRPAEAVNRKPGFQGPAAGGRIQEFDWDGNLVWDFEYHSEKRLPHHDAIQLPNGNALLICWEMIDEKEAVANGRRPETVKDSHLQPDCLVEIKPTGKTTGEIVWEWRSWDHLIQDRDSAKANFGNVPDHPERFDVNFIRGEEDQLPPRIAAKDANIKSATVAAKEASATKVVARVDAQKAVTTADAAKAQPKDASKKDQNRGPSKNPDWMHVNAVAFNADLDQIAMSSPSFNEIWIIDHSTTKEEAKGHTGGRWGKGGDILYRWGNPRAYKTGTKLDQRLFGQHNIQWIPKGCRGEGHLLVFNNGAGRTPEQYSSVDEFVPPTDNDGNYTRVERGSFGPAEPLWSYTASRKKDFYSWFISGAQRLPNGNTLINSGATGVVFEVTPENETVWKFANPFKPVANRPPPRGASSTLFEAVPASGRDALGIKQEERKKLDEIDKELNAKLEKLLSADQKKILAETSEVDVSKVPAGDYFSRFNQQKLKLTDTQTKELQALQKDFNPKIANILTEDQKRGLAKFKNTPAPARQGGPPGAGNTLFRATRYALDHPAFHGKSLKPGKTLVQTQQELDNPQPAKDTNSATPTTADASK